MKPFGAASLFAALPLVLAACGSPSSGRSGEDLYAEMCASCHGDDGRGDSRQLNLSPGLDLTRSRMVARGARGAIFRRITEGYGSMPAFGHKLQRGDVEELVELVSRFHRPSDGENRETR